MWPECCLCRSRGRWQPFEVAHSICQTPQQKQTAQQCFHQTDWLPQTFPVPSTSSFSAAFVLVNSCNYIQSVKCKSMGRRSLLGLQGPGTRGLAAIHNQEHVKIWLNIWPKYTESKNNTEHFNTFIHKCCHICCNLSFWTSVAPHAACPGCGQCSFLLRGSWRRSKSPTRQVGSVWPHNSTGSPFHRQWSTNNWPWDSSLYGTWWHAAGKRWRLKWHLPSFKWQCTRMTSSPLKTTVVSLRGRTTPKTPKIPKIIAVIAATAWCLMFTCVSWCLLMLVVVWLYDYMAIICIASSCMAFKRGLLESCMSRSCALHTIP